MINKERLLKMAKNYGLDISHCIDKLEIYGKILVEYNEKVNLTAITDDEGIENKHFLDSLLFANLKEVKGKIVDVGTGAGFPGVVAKLYKPDLDLTLMEPTGKRVDFLKYLCEELDIEATFAKERAEEAARKGYREQYDVACARAVSSLNSLSEYCLPLVKENGYFISMKGANAQDEITAAKGAIKKLGAKFDRFVEFELPDKSNRTLIVYNKISQTPTQYPRGGGKILKAPLK